MSETRKTIVLLEILDDESGRNWEEALGLPPAHVWNEKLKGVFVKIIYETHSTYHPISDGL